MGRGASPHRREKSRSPRRRSYSRSPKRARSHRSHLKVKQSIKSNFSILSAISNQMNSTVKMNILIPTNTSILTSIWPCRMFLFGGGVYSFGQTEIPNKFVMDSCDWTPREYGTRMPRGRYHDGRENPDPNPCLGVFGMSLHTTERDLRQIFGQFGEIESVQIVYDRFSGRSRGFGFVYFAKTRDATRAKEHLRDAVIDGMRVRVDYSVTRTTAISTHDRSAERRVSHSRSPPARARSRSSRSNTYSNSPPPVRRRRGSPRKSRSPSRSASP